MRYLVFTDIHGNLEALEALLKFIARKKVDHYLYLGDLVGYGASPGETIDLVRRLEPLSIIRGNHDKAVCGLDAIETFNPMAAMAIAWCRKNLTEDHTRYLCGLPKGPQVASDLLTICHGAPFDEDFYIFGEFDAAEAFQYLETRVGFFGHTHFPCLYVKTGSGVSGRLIEDDHSIVRLKKGSRYLINPGSVGQPRDRNPKAACVLFDSEESVVHFHRFDYDVSGAQEKILAQNLPAALAERLALGI